MQIHIYISLLFVCVCVCETVKYTHTSYSRKYYDMEAFLHVSSRQTFKTQSMNETKNPLKSTVLLAYKNTYTSNDRQITALLIKIRKSGRLIHHICVTKTSLRTCDRLKYKSFYKCIIYHTHTVYMTVEMGV